MADWLSLTCLGCHVRFRIKAAYAHLRGRCPECGLRIEPPRPLSKATKPDILDSDEPLGLVELEPEWPEPGRIEDEQEPEEYTVGKGPGPWIEDSRPKPEPAASSDIFAVADKVATPPAPPPPPPDIDIMAMVEEETAPTPAAPQVVPPPAAKLSEAELNPIREGPPPKRPLWDGIYTFPLRGTSLYPLFWLWLGITLLALVVTNFLETEVLEGFGGVIEAVKAVGLTLCFIGLMIFTGSYGAATFLAIIEDTSAGNATVQWPSGSWKEWFWRLFFITWLVACCFVAAGLLHQLIRLLFTPPTAVQVVLAWLPLLGLFPLFLLSTLSANSWWSLLHGPLLQKLGRHPQAAVMLFVHTALIGIPCLWIATVAVFGGYYSLAPVMGLVWAAGLLAYGRAVGRVGYVVREDAGKPTVKKKKKASKRAAVQVPADQSEGQGEAAPVDPGWGGWVESKARVQNDE